MFDSQPSHRERGRRVSAIPTLGSSIGQTRVDQQAHFIHEPLGERLPGQLSAAIDPRHSGASARGELGCAWRRSTRSDPTTSSGTGGPLTRGLDAARSGRTPDQYPQSLSASHARTPLTAVDHDE
jgi:hypothetical protein